MFWLGFGVENAAGFFAGVVFLGFGVSSLFSPSLFFSFSSFLVAGLGAFSPPLWRLLAGSGLPLR